MMKNLKKLKQRAEFFGFNKAGSFAEFKDKYLSTGENNSIINIEIDEKTPCLRKLSDGVIVDTTVIDITSTKADFKDWEFNWHTVSTKENTIRGPFVDGDNRLQGLVCFSNDIRNSLVKVSLAESAAFNNPHNKLYIKGIHRNRRTFIC